LSDDWAICQEESCACDFLIKFLGNAMLDVFRPEVLSDNDADWSDPMSSSTSMIVATVERLLARSDLTSGYVALREGAFPAALWESASAAGLPLLLCSEAAGGIGAGFDDAVELGRLCGAAGLPLPIVETLIGNWLLGFAGVEPRDNPVSPVIALESPPPDVEHLASRDGVPWARHADLLAVATQGHALQIALVPRHKGVVTSHGANMAGEPRDRVDLSACQAGELVWHDLPVDLTASTILARMALLRAALMVGAMEHALDLSVGYTSERQQFGRSLASFQVIQQTLAAMATQVAAARSAVAAAAIQVDPERIEFMAAVAKARAGDAAAIVAASAHQVHGAMGFTQEYSLGIATKRLWSWRSEDGSESHWYRWLGTRARGSGDLWSLITA
jgi:acyl-CoA dehydrogenase